MRASASFEMSPILYVSFPVNSRISCCTFSFDASAALRATGTATDLAARAPAAAVASEPATCGLDQLRHRQHEFVELVVLDEPSPFSPRSGVISIVDGCSAQQR